ncbi:hypothetical protein GOP47_0030286 [Adiantum capillus-veneris]|nr:hypothetical protein GOP47_0030286 [Adiantum capillus-veneris]
MLIADYLAHGAPIGPQNLEQCLRVANVSDEVDCCMLLPTKKKINFSFDLYPPVKRIRKPAHLVDASYIEKYKRAYELIRALPSNDPRSLLKQGDTHCSMCTGAYLQPGTDAILHIHYSWLFFPWHRWFIYFHERILAKLLGDPTFALPFWNWDNQFDGNSMPAYFDDQNSSLYDPNRDANHAPPALIQLNGDFNTTNNREIIRENLNQMYQDVVAPSTASSFMGGIFRLGYSFSSIDEQSEEIGGVFDNEVHGNVHAWVGNPLLPRRIDMGSFDRAGRDPIFYAHHANVDRLWDVWRFSLPSGPRPLFSDPDFLNASFIFYDEDQNLVKVTVRDCLDNSRLGIFYPSVPADGLWMHHTP